MADQKIIDRIRALLAKTTENGCTEGEAMAAMEKARELMDRYQLDLGAVGIEEEGVIRAFAQRKAYRHMQIKDRIANAIASFCDCKVWLDRDANRQITFLGLRSDAQFATWLLDSLDGFIRMSVAEYMVRAGFSMPTRSRRWQAEKAFILGAVTRISERLDKLTADRRRHAASDGRSLVVVKNQLVNKAMNELGIKLRSQSRYTSIERRQSVRVRQSRRRSRQLRQAGRWLGPTGRTNRQPLVGCLPPTTGDTTKMGLDQFAYRRPGSLPKAVDFDRIGDAETEIHYWRKHPNLQGWMRALYVEKGGSQDDFNCVPVELTLADLDRLESDVKCRALPPTTGFFFGQSDGSEIDDDLTFIAKARTVIAEGDSVFYTSWW